MKIVFSLFFNQELFITMSKNKKLQIEAFLLH